MAQKEVLDKCQKEINKIELKGMQTKEDNKKYKEQIEFFQK